jgi:hypothetical protein
MPNGIGNKPQTFDRLFERMDRNADGEVSKKEVKKHLKDAKVPKGLFGVIHSKASDGFIDNLDQDGNGSVNWNEFKGVAKDMLPADIKDIDGRIDPALADQTFGDLDTDQDGGVSSKELEVGTFDRLPEGQAFRGALAEVAAKLAMDALDTDGDGAIRRDEFDEAVEHASALATEEDD